MESSVIIHGDTWKLADIADEVAWCKEQLWAPSAYAKIGDHGHCSICWWTLAISDDPSVGQGYVTGSKNRIWLCSECYGKFIAS